MVSPQQQLEKSGQTGHQANEQQKMPRIRN
jgi:hypothetical protein